MSFLVNKIYNETGKILDIQSINSKFDNYILDEETERLIEYYQPYFEEFEKTVTIIDNIRNPFGIYKYVREYCESHGYFTKKTLQYGPEKGKLVDDVYIADDPDEYRIIITDHISLLGAENGLTQHQSISRFSSEYCLAMRDRFRCTIVNVQQQSAESEKQQFNNVGGSIVAKLKPSPDGLGDNKLTARDANLMIGLFAPHRYDIKQYNGYDISLLKDNYRELIVSLNRDGEASFTDDLFFNGAVNYFEEAPKEIRTVEEYNKIIRRVRK